MSDTAEQAAVRAVIEDRIDAIHAGDAERANACLAKEMVSFEFAPPLAVNGDAVLDIEATRAWIESFDAPPQIEMRDLTIHASGDVAFAYSLHHIRASSVGGPEIDIWMRSTLGLKRICGEWKFVHGHTSVPVHMDGNFRAAIDLRPS